MWILELILFIFINQQDINVILLTLNLSCKSNNNNNNNTTSNNNNNTNVTLTILMYGYIDFSKCSQTKSINQSIKKKEVVHIGSFIFSFRTEKFEEKKNFFYVQIKTQHTINQK